jgi:hypothetical protein
MTYLWGAAAFCFVLVLFCQWQVTVAKGSWRWCGESRAWGWEALRRFGCALLTAAFAALVVVAAPHKQVWWIDTLVGVLGGIGPAARVQKMPWYIQHVVIADGVIAIVLVYVLHVDASWLVTAVTVIGEVSCAYQLRKAINALRLKRQIYQIDPA